MIKFKVNRIIKFLLLSDFVFWSGWGLVAPIFAIFIVDKVVGGNEFVVGISTAIYSALSALLRIPLGLFLDNQPHERSDLWFAITGLWIASLSSLFFAFAFLPWHIYVLQAIHATGMAMNLSGWTALYTRHIDKGRESTEWGISAVSVGVGAALTAVIGGWMAANFGFKAVFICVGITGFLGSAMLLFIYRQIQKGSGHGLYFSLKELARKAGE
ncbi:MAG: MFS transporter [Minisyncoccales bacterium]